MAKKPVRKIKEGMLVKGYEERYNEIVEKPLKITDKGVAIHNDNLAEMSNAINRMLALSNGEVRYVDVNVVDQNGISINGLSITDVYKLFDNSMDTYSIINYTSGACHNSPIAGMVECEGTIEIPVQSGKEFTANNIVVKLQTDEDWQMTLSVEVAVKVVYEDNSEDASSSIFIDNAVNYAVAFPDPNKKIKKIIIDVFRVREGASALNMKMYGIIYISNVNKVMITDADGIVMNIPDKQDLDNYFSNLSDVISQESDDIQSKIGTESGNIATSVNNQGSEIITHVDEAKDDITNSIDVNSTSIRTEITNSKDEVLTKMRDMLPKVGDFILLKIEGNLSSGNEYTIDYTIQSGEIIYIDFLELQSYEGNGYAWLDIDGENVAYTSVYASAGWGGVPWFLGGSPVRIKVTGDGKKITLHVYADSSDYFFAKAVLRRVKE